MIFLYAIIFGIVQGLTEFFPVSSSGHLLITHKIFPIFTRGLDVTFDVALHLSTLCILLLFYGKDFFRYVRAFFHRDAVADRRVGWILLLATIPSALVGYYFEDLIVARTREISLVAVTLIFGGVLFLMVERWGKRTVQFDGLSFGKAFAIGCAQAFALIPGMSRSGITIIAGLALGLKRDTATHFSFLLAVPIIALAGAKRLLELFFSHTIDRESTLLFVIGFVTAAIVGAICIRYLLEHVKTKTFIPFAVYRIALGILLFVVLFFERA